jgi:hypothetical protein
MATITSLPSASIGLRGRSYSDVILRLAKGGDSGLLDARFAF